MEGFGRETEVPMRRHFLTRVAVLGTLLALAADADAIEGNDTKELVTTASTDTGPGTSKASIFGVPREAQILFW